MTGKYLITTDNYFIAPDGKSYRAVWGDCETLTSQEALGFTPNRNSANWFVMVGTEQDHVIVAGCQIHYAIRSENAPFVGITQERVGTNYELKDRDPAIYIPDPAARPQAEEIPESKGSEQEWMQYRDYESMRGIRVTGNLILDLIPKEGDEKSDQAVNMFLKNLDVIKGKGSPENMQTALDLMKFYETFAHKISRFLVYESREKYFIIMNLERELYSRKADDPKCFILHRTKKPGGPCMMS